RTGAQVSVVAADRTVVVDSGDVGADIAEFEPALTRALTGQSVSGQQTTASGDSLLYVAVPVRSGTDILGAVGLIYPAGDVDDAVESRVRGLTLVGLVTLAAAALVAVLLSGVVTQRLRRLRYTSAQLAEGDLSARAETGGMAELDDLSRSFNAMAERIEDLVAAQRGFAGDASHQLRTPLTALRLRIEQAAADIDHDPTAAREVLESAHAEADRLQHLVDGLLLLARADGSRPSAARTELVAIARERAEAWQPLAEERRVEVRAEARGECWVWAVPGTVEQIVDNYVDNALEVAPRGSDVVIRVLSGASTLAVDDSGPGLSDAERARAFDRFWRGGSDRSGSGLGLAIVRSLASASGAHVALERADSGGVRAIARFRRSPEPRQSAGGDRG
ncbi:MAG TPA: HAMP domain-containing sensor histidine kinase, partial [Candidatus Nanopelagicales bacterium]|nr:HAMP domain-containing sensor histidine kinase [Candidatus Nanopelagicales bacterium]